MLVSPTDWEIFVNTIQIPCNITQCHAMPCTAVRALSPQAEQSNINDQPDQGQFLSSHRTSIILSVVNPICVLLFDFASLLPNGGKVESDILKCRHSVTDKTNPRFHSELSKSGMCGVELFPAGQQLKFAGRSRGKKVHELKNS